MTVVFDKLSFMRHLESEGTFPRPQAEKLSEAFHNAVQETVATTADIARLESRIDAMDARIDAKLAGVDAKLAGVDAKMARLEGRMDAKMAGLDGRMASLEGKIDSKMAGLDGRMASLENKIDASLANSKVWTVGVAVALFSALSAIRFFGH